MTPSSVLLQGALHALFMTDSERATITMIMFHSNFLSGMRDNEVLFPTGYDVIVSLPPGDAARTFLDGFWKSDHDFLIALYSIFSAVMHGFQDEEVLLRTVYDVIFSSSLGGVSHKLCWRNLKKRPLFHNHCSLTYFAYLLPFRSYSTFYFGR